MKVAENQEPFSRRIVWFALLVAGLIILNRFFFAAVWKPLFLKSGPAFCNSIRTSWLSCVVTDNTLRIGRDAIGACFGPQTLGFNGFLFLFLILGTFLIFSESFRASKLITRALVFGVPIVLGLTILRLLALIFLFRAIQDEHFRITYTKEIQTVLIQSGWVIYGSGLLLFVIWLRLSILNKVEKIKCGLALKSGALGILLLCIFSSHSAFAVSCKACTVGSFDSAANQFYSVGGCVGNAAGCWSTTQFSGCTVAAATNITAGCNGCGGISMDINGSFVGCKNDSTTCAAPCAGASEFPTALTPLMMFFTFLGIYYLLGWRRKFRVNVDS